MRKRNILLKSIKKIAKIDKSQKIKLFKKIWPEYIKDTKRLYDKFVFTDTVKEIDINISSTTNLTWKKTEWDDLKDKIQDVILDLRYQGQLKKEVARAASKNDIKYLVKFIKDNNYLKQFELARRRVDYLHGKYSPKGF